MEPLMEAIIESGRAILKDYKKPNFSYNTEYPLCRLNHDDIEYMHTIFKHIVDKMEVVEVSKDITLTILDFSTCMHNILINEHSYNDKVLIITALFELGPEFEQYSSRLMTICSKI